MNPNLQAQIALENIADLPKGKSIEVKGQSNTLVVKRHSSGCWVSWIKRVIGSPCHTRWADNNGQLLEDLEHFFLTDTLPVSKVNWF